MVRQSMKLENGVSQVQDELLDLLLEEDLACYPWNPTDPEAEAYFAELEENCNLEDWSDEEIKTRSENFFASLNACWTQKPSLTEAVKVSLAERFAARVPQAWLDAIAHKAQQIVSSNLSLTDKLVQTVGDLLPNWAKDDLFVFARPVALSMRGEADAITRRWDELSEVEQARLSMAIARYAIDELQQQD